MWCSLSRWMISRAEDTGEKLPAVVERHVGRCGGCAGFARSSASLGSRLRTERPDWLAKAPDFAVELGPDADRVRVVEEGARAPRRSWLSLRPLPVAAAALVLLAGALVLFQLVLKTPPPTADERASALAALKTITAAPQGFQGIIEEAGSPLERERLVLEKSVSSAVEYLQARLNIKIERREPRAKSS